MVLDTDHQPGHDAMGVLEAADIHLAVAHCPDGIDENAEHADRQRDLEQKPVTEA